MRAVARFMDGPPWRLNQARVADVGGIGADDGQEPTAAASRTAPRSIVVALCSWCHGCRYAEDMAWRTAYEISLDIAAPIDTVWGLLADGRSWSDWSFIPRSELECEGIPASDGVGAIRRLGMPPIVSRERMVQFTPPSRLVYESVGGNPVSGYRATVELAEVDGRTKVQWSGSFEPK